jgi:hypothetical protein
MATPPKVNYNTVKLTIVGEGEGRGLTIRDEGWGLIPVPFSLIP